MHMKKVDLAKITLGLLFLSLLIISCFMVLRPFLPALVWATMITIATWPLMQMAQRLLWGKRTLAALLMSCILLLMFVIPLFMALANVAEKAPMLIDLGTELSHSPPPELLWLQQVPLVGDKLFEFWQQILASGGQVLFAKLAPYFGQTARWLAAQAGNLGLLIAGIPYVMILVVLMCLLIVAQIGPFPVLLASVGYLYWSGDTTWGTFLLVWSLLAGTMDNFLRPFLIKRGADLPLILILVGVIGGLLALGIIGLFIGPVVLAVGYTLLDAWIKEGEQTPAAEAPASPPVE